MTKSKFLPHIIALILFIAVPTIYQSPLLQGKVLRSGDVIHGIGNNQELVEYRKANGEEALWNSRLFSGMPSFQMSILHNGNIGEKINRVLANLGSGSVSIFVLMSISFYVLLITLGINPWLSVIMAFGFSLSSFNVISIEAGHNWKIRTLAYAPGVLAGVLLIYRQKLLQGAAIMSLFLCLHLTSNHFQITYYLILMLLFFGAFEFYNAIKTKTLNPFLKATGTVFLAALIGFGPTISKLWTTLDYSKETIRGGKSELILNDKDAKNKGSGLDRDYAMRWSYGMMESFTLIIPHFMGGASYEALDANSAIAKSGFPKQYLKQIPTYWGEQTFQSGPVYIGVVLFFLFVFAMFFLKGRTKYWVLSFSIFMIILAWGRHFSFVSHFLFDYMPMFNKFRTPSMSLIMLSITVPFLGALMIQELLSAQRNKHEIMKALKDSLIVSLGLVIVFGLFGSYIYDFTAASDVQLKTAGWPVDKIKEDRASMLRSDSIRSIIYILLSAVVLFGFIQKKLKREYFLAALGLLIISDLWMVDKRYLNEDDFVKSKEFSNIHAPNFADQQILADPDSHFRVFNVSVNPFTDARTSYFHKSIGGYHAAKLLRYQEIIENQLSKNNREVINMLNTKYFIAPNKQKEPVAQLNPEANGVGWFVQSLIWVNSANDEMSALDNFTSKTEAIIDNRFRGLISDLADNQSGKGQVLLETYDPKHMVYQVNNDDSKNQLAVFSEIYYSGNKDWKAYIDGKYINHIRADYILRGLSIPTGQHKVEFKFEPKAYLLGNQISMAFSGILLLLLGLAGFMSWRESQPKSEE